MAAEIYRVVTVETAKAPTGGAQGEWCRYVLSSEQSRIVGRFHGSLTKARRNAESLAKGLNARVASGKAPWTPRSRARKNVKTAKKAASKKAATH